MIKFNKEEFLVNGKGTLDLTGEIESVIETLSGSYDKVLLTGVGGTLFELTIIKDLFNRYSDVVVELYSSAETEMLDKGFIDERTIVITGSKSGDTKELIAACNYCKSKGAKIISFTGSMEYPLAKVSDYPIISTIPGMTHTYVRFYIIAFKIMNSMGYYENYQEFKDSLDKLYPALVEIKERFEETGLEIAKKYHDEKWQIWTGSGLIFPELGMFTMCILEEMQWMRTRLVSSSEFFHGTLELVEKDVLVYVVKSIDDYRKLDERVEKFLVDKTDKLVVIDLNDYRIENVSEELQKIYSPIVFNALTRGRLAYHFENKTGHDLEMRRYYRQFEY